MTYRYRNISVTPELYERLEERRKRLGLRSVAAVVFYLEEHAPATKAILAEAR